MGSARVLTKVSGLFGLPEISTRASGRPAALVLPTAGIQKGWRPQVHLGHGTERPAHGTAPAHDHHYSRSQKVGIGPSSNPKA